MKSDKKYTFETSDGIHSITLKRGSQIWCNYDCPRIYDEGGWMMTDGLIIEAGSDEERKQICNFIYLSAILYYKKWKPDVPNPREPFLRERGEGFGNGYLSNFITQNLRFHSLERLHEWAPWTKDWADEAWERRAKKLQRDILDAYSKRV